MNTPSKYSARLIKKNESVFCLSLLVYSLGGSTVLYYYLSLATTVVLFHTMPYS